MGYIRHHAIIVTGSDFTAIGQGNPIGDAHDKATLLFNGVCPVTPIMKGRINGYQSFMVAPDGSKEGWEESGRGDLARAEFIVWVNKSSPPGYLDWFLVEYGGDGGASQIVLDHHKDVACP